MKAVLVIDMPKSCEDCPLMLWDSLSEYYGACTPTLKEINCVTEEYKENENRSIRPSWCPLSHPLKRVGHDYYIYDRKYLLDNLDREIEMLKKVKEYESNISV